MSNDVEEWNELERHWGELLGASPRAAAERCRVVAQRIWDRSSPGVLAEFGLPGTMRPTTLEASPSAFMLVLLNRIDHATKADDVTVSVNQGFRIIELGRNNVEG